MTTNCKHLDFLETNLLSGVRGDLKVMVMVVMVLTVIMGGNVAIYLFWIVKCAVHAHVKAPFKMH